MFRETLLDSSPRLHKRRRWPMAAAFSLQMVAAVLLIVTPMITTGVIPLSARTVVFTPTFQPHEPARPDSGTPGTRVSGPAAATRLVPIYNNGPNVIRYGRAGTTANTTDPGPDVNVGCNNQICLTCFGDGHGSGILPQLSERPKRIPVSVLSEAQLLNKVVPAYPMPAQHSGVQGDVKLHAIISRDGSIQSLSLISGHPLLARAAIEAVEQWRYRPYILNGEPVEVETWITVSFKKSN